MKYCNLIGSLQVVYSMYYPMNTAANTYYTRRKQCYTPREHLLHLRYRIMF